MFTEKVSEVEENRIRYVLRCNPIRKGEIAKNRESKLYSIKEFADNRTKYLSDHPRVSFNYST